MAAHSQRPSAQETAPPQPPQALVSVKSAHTALSWTLWDTGPGPGSGSTCACPPCHHSRTAPHKLGRFIFLLVLLFLPISTLSLMYKARQVLVRSSHYVANQFLKLRIGVVDTAVCADFRRRCRVVRGDDVLLLLRSGRNSWEGCRRFGRFRQGRLQDKPYKQKQI